MMYFLLDWTFEMLKAMFQTSVNSNDGLEYDGKWSWNFESGKSIQVEISSF